MNEYEILEIARENLFRELETLRTLWEGQMDGTTLETLALARSVFSLAGEELEYWGGRGMGSLDEFQKLLEQRIITHSRRTVIGIVYAPVPTNGIHNPQSRSRVLMVLLAVYHAHLNPACPELDAKLIGAFALKENL